MPPTNGVQLNTAAIVAPGRSMDDRRSRRRCSVTMPGSYATTGPVQTTTTTTSTMNRQPGLDDLAAGKPVAAGAWPGRRATGLPP